MVSPRCWNREILFKQNKTLGYEHKIVVEMNNQ